MTTPLASIVGPDAPTTSSIRIQKAKVKESLLTAEFTEQRDQDAPARSFTLISHELVHPDLQHRFSQLVPHLCLLCEQLTETPDYWPQDEAEQLPTHFDAFTVTGFSTGSKGTGVTLIGQRQLQGNRVLNLTSPYVSFESEHEEYGYVGLLEMAVGLTTAEVEQALRGKHSDAGKQLDLFGQEPEDDRPLLAEATAYAAEHPGQTRTELQQEAEEAVKQHAQLVEARQIPKKRNRTKKAA